MTARDHDRIPFAVQVEFRTASSFLVSYSLNLSRGGLFLETTDQPPLGSDITLQFAVPGAGPILITGTVNWRREQPDDEGPAGIGVEFDDIRDSLGTVIDKLVSEFEGLNILLVSSDRQDRSTLTRLVKSIISTAEVAGAADEHLADTLLTDDVDVAVVDLDSSPESGLRCIKMAQRGTHPIPTVALTSNNKLRARARAAGASELATNPPPFPEFQRCLVRALGRPVRVG